MSMYFDFAVTTIFAREVLEASIIIGEYRTIILRCEQWPEGMTQRDALRSVTLSSLVAAICALFVCIAIAFPLALLSQDFEAKTVKVIEGVSKIVAAICILQLSLKLPKWLSVYASNKRSSTSAIAGLTLRSIRFNVAWNIWREVAECGVFLIPFFLSGEGTKAIPLSAVAGSIVGLLLGVGIYYANSRMKDKVWLAIFMSVLLVLLSTGLFTGGCHNFEEVFGVTAVVWRIEGDFWSVNRLPMTVLKPFGYSDTRTVLQIVCFWCWLLFCCVLHYRKWSQSQLQRDQQQRSETNGLSEISAADNPLNPSMSCSVVEDVEAHADAD
jgi:high-affinity iron transporter